MAITSTFYLVPQVGGRDQPAYRDQDWLSVEGAKSWARHMLIARPELSGVRVVAKGDHADATVTIVHRTQPAQLGQFGKPGTPLIVRLASIQDVARGISADPTATIDYKRAALVGLVSGLEAVGWDARDAIALVVAWVPERFRLAIVPQPWWDCIPQLRPR